MRTVLVIGVLASIFSHHALGQTKKAEKKGLLAKMEGSEFQIEKDLVEKFYNDSSITASKSGSDSSGTSELSPQIGLMSLKELSLENDYFKADYAENLGSIPLISFAVANQVLKTKAASIFAVGSFGYAYKQGTYKLESSSGTEIEDTVTFQWVPLQIASRLDFEILRMGFLTPSIEGGVGTNWFHQTGTVDGVDQGFWVPVYHGALALTLFGGAIGPNVTFGGITIRSQYQRSISDDQAFSGWYHNLGTKILL
ncbi:MAG: hypothetical protein R3B45_07665 [Bdellovibrionota bacterium]